MLFYISVRVDAVAPCHLDFLASYVTSVSRQGKVLLQDLMGRKIHMYKYQAAKGTFTKIRQLHYPRGISSDSDLYMYDSQDGTVVLLDYKSPTLVISREGEQVQEWQMSGCLIGCLSNKRRVYMQLNKDRTSQEVCITDESNTKRYLRPSPGYTWGIGWISACEDEVTGNKAIRHAPFDDESQPTLEIYNSECK